MPLIIVPLALDAAAIALFWMSELSLPIKIALSILVIIKFCIYMLLVLLTEQRIGKIIGLALTFGLNAAGVIFAICNGMWLAAIPFVTISVLVLLWNTNEISLLRKGRD